MASWKRRWIRIYIGLKGEAIHDFGKLIVIADVFDAINSNRGYKNIIFFY